MGNLPIWYNRKELFKFNYQERFIKPISEVYQNQCNASQNCGIKMVIRKCIVIADSLPFMLQKAQQE